MGRKLKQERKDAEEHLRYIWQEDEAMGAYILKQLSMQTFIAKG